MRESSILPFRLKKNWHWLQNGNILIELWGKVDMSASDLIKSNREPQRVSYSTRIIYKLPININVYIRIYHIWLYTNNIPVNNYIVRSVLIAV